RRQTRASLHAERAQLILVALVVVAHRELCSRRAPILLQLDAARLVAAATIRDQHCCQPGSQTESHCEGAIGLTLQPATSPPADPPPAGVPARPAPPPAPPP